MSFSEFKKAGFVSRMLTIFALSLLLIFSARVVLENTELEKIIQHSTARSLALLLGYWVLILSSNYLYALRGRNFMDWRTELLIAVNFVVFFSVCTLPWLFPAEAACPWWKFWCTAAETRTPRLSYFWLLVVQTPLLLLATVRVQAFLSESRSV